jgi:KipI family sensor histidine kinase inhibitor
VPRESLVDALRSVRPVVDDRDTPELVIPVRYDGPDLAAVAGAAGLSAGQVVALHSGAVYEVAFCGFAPGFGYLTGLPEPLHMPRRATPRTTVPAGSVAIAAGYAAVYPGASPGGWHLLGATDLILFDPVRDPPALLAPGTRVRFDPT